jgi:3-oxoacyl-[acyl-carrier protein] reductase
MDLRLTGKIALVTGTGSQVGFGRGIALKLAEEGCDVICADIDLPGAEKTAESVKVLGRKSIGIQVDITDRTSVDTTISRALEEFDHIDILVNCAGRASGIRSFTEMTQEMWDIDININLRGTMNMTQALLPYMLERSYGKIVNFSTHAAHQPSGLAGAAVYIAAKSGTVMFSKTLASEVGHKGININIIAPGPGNTNFHRTGGDPGMIELVENLDKSGRTTTPEDIGNTVAWLVSDIANKLSGQVIEVAAPSGGSRD